MTFVDPGADYAPPPGHLHLTIHPKPPTPSKVQDSLDDLADWAPPESKAARGAGAAAQDPLDMLADWKPPEIKRQVPTGEALGKGVMQGATFGLGPAIEGLGAATGESKVPAFNPNYPGEEIYDVGQSFRGAMKLLDEQLIQPLMTGDKPKQEVLDAFRRGREAAHKDYDLADEQHPGTFLAGQMFGSLGTPGFGAARAGTLMARAGYGFLGGAVGGGLYGAGQGVSAGEGVGDIAKRVGYGAGLGGLGGASVGAAIGPRVVNPLSPGQRAKATAEGLGAPIPVGLASDNPAINATAAAVRSAPIFGSRMGSMLEKTQEAAGGRIEEIAAQQAGMATDRAVADTMVRPAMQGVIDRNKQLIDANYNAVRNRINTAQAYTMPRTDAMLTQVMRERRAAGWTNPAQGLEQFRNLAGGATFNGAHRARVDAREAGNVLTPNPGYNAADFNRITRAMTADLRDIVQVSARGNPRTALEAFDRAEQQFGQISEQNELLNKLVNAPGEGAIRTLLAAPKEVGGNLKLLAQLRRSMPPQDFGVISGAMLSELGYKASTGQFSLSQFVTNWNKTSEGAKRVLFDPQHRANIEEIVNLGTKIKSSLRDTNTSHTSNVIILFDLARDAIEAVGAIGAGTAAGLSLLHSAALAVPAIAFTHWISSPATASSMSAWSRAWFGLAQAPREPARIAAFNLATRNLSNQIGVSVDRILSSAKLHAEDSTDEQEAPRSVH